MSSATLASKTFDADDQVVFARLSGDFNPIHMDPLAARRTQAGTPVVHGMHVVLWALDRIVESGAAAEGISGVKVQFVKFIPVGATVNLKLARGESGPLRAEIDLGGLATTLLSVTLGAPAKAGARRPPSSKRRPVSVRPFASKPRSRRGSWKSSSAWTGR